MTIQAALREIQGKIAVAARVVPDQWSGTAGGGLPVELLAVSKGHSADAVRAVARAGHLGFAENRVQEAAAKFPELRAEFPDLRLHLIGPLQTNKVRDAVRLFDSIHTVDRTALAEKLANEMARQGRDLPCFVQVNTGEELQKSGVMMHDLPALLKFCRNEVSLNIQGLMCIPPLDEPPEKHFKLLAELAAEHHLKLLSMGMSADYELAIQCGATHVRVGSALFGDRK